jgi:hypothetical protein
MAGVMNLNDSNVIVKIGTRTYIHELRPDLSWSGLPHPGNDQPGDILTACDNELNVPAGYIGHAAIVAAPGYIVEAVVTFPYVQLATVDSFREAHPLHARYRPNDPAMGRAAADYAAAYYRTAQRNYSQGIIVPPFSFSQRIPLDDPWRSIYCSKLVWLSYRYGANYPFPNDHFVFSPEDLDTVLSRDANFHLVYKHPEFKFLVDT